MSWIKEQLVLLFGPKFIRSAVRTALAALAGGLIALDIDPAAVESFKSAAEPVVVGLILYAIAQGWSWLDKKKNQPNSK